MPKLKEGTVGTSLEPDTVLPDETGKKDGVGGSAKTLEDEVTGNVNPAPLSETTARLGSRLPTDICGKPGFVPEDCCACFERSRNSLETVEACCPLLCKWRDEFRPISFATFFLPREPSCSEIIEEATVSTEVSVNMNFF